MKIQDKKISELKQYKLNAKKHPQSQIDGIAESIKRFGFNQPVVVDSENTIIVGHGRIEAAKKCGIKSVPCVIKDDLTDQEIKAYRIIDNRLNETEWDQELLELDLEEIDVDFSDFGVDFDIDVDVKEEKCGAVGDNVVPDDAPTICQTGDLWKLGRHRLLCGDSTNIEDVERLVGNAKIDLVFTDPPYDFPENDLLKSFDNCGVFQNFQIWMGSDRHHIILGAHKLDEFYHFIIQNFKAGTLISNSKPITQHVVLSIFGKTNSRFVNLKDGFSTILNIPTTRVTDDHSSFRMGKRIELPFQIIIHYSDISSFILDVFGGTGSTLIACEKSMRSCLMMELEPKYCDVIIKRWEDYTGEVAVKL